MRTTHPKRHARRTALATALGLVFGAGAHAANINVPGSFPTLSQAINDENNRYFTAAIPDCSTDTIVLAAGFVSAESAPLPPIQCPGLTIRGSGTYPSNMSQVSGAGSFSYGSCGLQSWVAASIANLDITGFIYGPGLCGQFNVIAGNHIHGNATGIELSGGTRVSIGGTKPTARNFIYDNVGFGSGYGLYIEYGGAADVLGNNFGTPDGSSFKPNGTGIIVNSGADATIDGNLIAESLDGIDMQGSGSITNNTIGLDASGTGNLGAGVDGIVLDTTDPSVTVSGNTVGNMQYGIHAAFLTGGTIANNGVGVTRSGGPLSNSGGQTFGIMLLCSTGVQVTGNTVGGQQSGGAGVVLADTSASTLDGNHIGIAADGSTSLRNGGHGVLVASGACVAGLTSAGGKRASARSASFALASATSGNTFSNNNVSSNGGYGFDFAAGSMSSNNLLRNNTVSNNANSGIAFLDSASIDNAIIGNLVFGNAPKNIDLSSGANEGIPSPQIQSVVQNGTTTVVTYQIDNSTGTAHNYTVEFFTNPSAGQPAGTTFQRQVYQPGVLGVQTFSETFTGSLDNFSLTSTLSVGAGGWLETSEFSPIGTATRVIPAVTFSPVATDFGQVYVHQTSGTRTITATNGTANAVATSAPSVTPPFIIRATDCGASLAAHSSCSVDVVFAPSTSGFASGTLAFGAFTASLTGSAIDAPILDVTGLIDFGTYIPGTPTLTRTATLTNSGSAVVTIDDISVSGPFGLSHDCPINLRPGDTCTLTVTFGSSTLGTAAGAITIRSNALGGARTIALGALVQARPEPVIEVHPDSLTFGNGLIGSQGPSMRVIVTNSGGVAAILGSMTTTDDYVVVSTTCTSSLAPLSSCSADIALRPIGFGSRPGSLSFTSNADGSPHIVGLGGTGCRPPGVASNRGGPTDPCSP